jgi:MFS family permease
MADNFTKKARKASGGDKHSRASSSSNLQTDHSLAPPIDPPKKMAPQYTPGQDEAAVVYPGKIKTALIMIGIYLSVFCLALDNSIIATAIPRITDQFHALDDVGWYASSYLLTTCAFQLSYGKLYTFYPVKWVYLSALCLFELGSLICAVAPNSTALIVGRAIAGMGSAGVYGGAFLIISYTIPLHLRPTFTAGIAAVYGTACCAGPLLGGLFTDSAKLTWRFCFWINLPLGFFTCVFILFFFSSPPQEKAANTSFKYRLRQMDLPGLSFFLPGVICLFLGLQWGGTKYDWKSARIIVLLVLAILLLIGFVIVQVFTGENATVPLRILKNRAIWTGALFGTCQAGVLFLFLYYVSQVRPLLSLERYTNLTQLPIYFQAIKGVSAVKSGVMSIPMILGFVIFSMFTGFLTTTTGYYVPFAIAAVIFMSTGSGLLTTLMPDSGHAIWIGYQFLLGVGIGCGMQTSMIAAQTALPLSDIAIGSAIMMFVQGFSGALFVSIAQNVFSNQLVKYLKVYVPEIDPKIVLNVGATQLRSEVPAASYNAVLLAYNKALTQSYYVGVAMACLSVVAVIFMPWLSVKGPKSPSADEKPSS